MRLGPKHLRFPLRHYNSDTPSANGGGQGRSKDRDQERLLTAVLPGRILIAENSGGDAPVPVRTA
jgi:hypothetical protein